MGSPAAFSPSSAQGRNAMRRGRDARAFHTAGEPAAAPLPARASSSLASGQASRKSHAHNGSMSSTKVIKVSKGQAPAPLARDVFSLRFRDS